MSDFWIATGSSVLAAAIGYATFELTNGWGALARCVAIAVAAAAGLGAGLWGGRGRKDAKPTARRVRIAEDLRVGKNLDVKDVTVQGGNTETNIANRADVAGDAVISDVRVNQE